MTTLTPREETVIGEPWDPTTPEYVLPETDLDRTMLGALIRATLAPRDTFKLIESDVEARISIDGSTAVTDEGVLTGRVILSSDDFLDIFGYDRPIHFRVDVKGVVYWELPKCDVNERAQDNYLPYLPVL